MSGTIPAPGFLSYAPVALAFGTSGLRGLVADITDLEAYINVKGAVRYLLANGDVDAGSSIVVAGDLRPSTDRILRASARAIVDAGCSVENAGKIPTPALIFHAMSTGRAAVMVTGSHIPFDRNGIKISKTAGEILKSDEPGIMAEVAQVRAEEYGQSATASLFTATGMLKTSAQLPRIDGAAEERYVRRYVTSFAPNGLADLRVLVYEHSAVGREILARILRELGAEVVSVGRTETFVPIDTENVTDDLLERLEALVASDSESERVDAIVSTDGDSDRPLVAAVVPTREADSRGRRVRFLPGDLLGIVVAEYLRADAVVVPVTSNDAVDRRMRDRGILLRSTKVGSPYVIAAMNELRAAGTHARVVGWEANGGFLTGSEIALARALLRALPTRDSTLPILANLFAAAEQRVGVGELWRRLPARFGRSGLVDGVSPAASAAMLTQMIPHGDVIEVAFDGDGRVVALEPAGAPALLSEVARAAWSKLAGTLSRIFTAPLGFDAIVRINVLDGARVRFANGDVAHIRPSGNAPQLRIYANCDSQARADEIVDLAIAEPDGLLRLVERAFS